MVVWRLCFKNVYLSKEIVIIRIRKRCYIDLYLKDEDK